jgi:glycosyltransferase involved in cell wall biosynthesis
MRRSDKPKVHWVSPIPPAQTDIAHYTHRILPELAEATDLTLWTDARHWDREIEQICPVRKIDAAHMMPRDFAKAGYGDGPDAIFIHIGNSWVFHAGLLQLARRIPSIIVLHDTAIQEMCFDAMRFAGFPRDVYEAEMARWYGAEGLAAAQAVFERKSAPNILSQTYPGFEITLDRAVSVLAHTPAAFEAAQATGIAPAYLLDLPFRPSDVAPSPDRATDGPLRLVQFGHIGPNRRLGEILDALAPLKAEIDFKLDIMGNVWDRAFLSDRLEQTGLADRVEVHGFVPEPDLDAKLAEAHLVFNLRYPTMGEASGSQLRIWNAAAASVVTDLGWYGSLPDETVFKVPLEGEIPALQDLVRRINANRSLGVSLGAAGRARLEARHTPTLYAQGIRHVAERFPEDAAKSLQARRVRTALAKTPVSSGLYRNALKRRL